MAKTKTQANPPRGRRYVGTAETVGFIMFHASGEVSIRPTRGEWVDWIMNISKAQQALWGPLMTVWDIVNDVFMAALIEKTRTRFGKFRPYLLLYPIYGLPMDTMILLLPFIFWGAGADFMPKVVSWVVWSMFNEFTDTIGNIARTGMLANITPDPQERISLITKSKVLAIGTNLPDLLFKLLRDIITNKKYAEAAVGREIIRKNMRTLYTIMGFSTMALASALSIYFAIVSKERVVGSNAAKEKPPTIRESLAALRTNRPMFMLMLAEILDAFNIKGQQGAYYDSILNFTNMGTVSGIPGGFISTPSYFYVAKLRERFSTKAVWIASENISKPVILGIFFFGMIKTRTAVRGISRMFMHIVPMIFAYMAEDMVAMTLYGAKKVIPDEIRNECIDYGEWKSGFRSEAMVGVLKGVPVKVANIFGSSITNMIMHFIGFQTGEGYLGQTEKTAIGVFAMATIVPTLTGLISVIPKLLYNINQQDREVMYAQLAERRAAALAAHAGARGGAGA
jgi:Na+/melibiose symporter-like transporter